MRQYFVFPESFLGHIGGDDFIAILNHHDFRQVSEEVITGFEKIKRTFYNQEDLDNQFVLGEGRSGIHRPIPLVSVSIAVVTNAYQEYEGIDQIVKEATRIKKVCKSIAGSVICGNEDL